MSKPSNDTYESWGRYPKALPDRVERPAWRHEVPDLSRFDAPVLPYGKGRSYGDVCLNEDGVLLDTRGLSRFMAFDAEEGLLRCEAGTTLKKILKLIVPHGWFLPVTPGTKHVTAGGAIANDVHGKNHHRAGTFGRHVTCFELLRSTGERLICSPEENAALYRATIGGLGLTGLITWAEFHLKHVPGPGIRADQIRFESLEAFFALSEASSSSHDYTAAWVDGLSSGKSLGRGLYLRGNAAPLPGREGEVSDASEKLRVPLDAPSTFLSRPIAQAFNALYYWGRRPTVRGKLMHYEPFFYPLDAVGNWNRLYGARGFLQYQCVLPFDGGKEALREVLRRVAGVGSASFLAVLKTFGDVSSPGLLSFPQPGYTLALDFSVSGQTFELLDNLDQVVRRAGGAVYPAKDARMAPESFRAYFPQWEAFSEHVDPGFSSSFWRRVTESDPA